MDFYNIMGVSRDASLEQIKKAYWALAKVHHPDKNPGDQDCEKRFKQISEAYEVLSNDLKRADYNRKTASRPPPKPPTPKPEPKKETKKQSSGSHPLFGDGVEVVHSNDVACSYFGNSMSGRNVMLQVKLTPREMEQGGHKPITFKKRRPCSRCVGDGQIYSKCPHCKDHPNIRKNCTHCEFSGLIFGHCKDCNGSGNGEYRIFQTNLAWSAGIQPGHQVIIKGEGEVAPMKMPGDLRVVVV